MYKQNTTDFKDYRFQYDNANNILRKIISGKENLYTYDELNRLTNTTNRGDFEVDVKKKQTQQIKGTVTKDYAGEKAVDFEAQETNISLDQNALSIGVDLERMDVKVSRIELLPDAANHRIDKEKLTLYVSYTNMPDEEAVDYWQEVDREGWTIIEKDNNLLEISLLEPVPARYVKVHCYFDDRDVIGDPMDLSTFRNSKEEIITVYYMVDTMYETYTYDESSNRTTYNKAIPLEYDENEAYTYYTNTNRLKEDGKNVYAYDANGNLTEKGDTYTIDTEDNITYNDTEGTYWSYEYDVLNRLIKVSKSESGKLNAQVVSEYTYDHQGYRIKKVRYADTGTETTYYAFGTDGQVLYKQKIEEDKYEEYIYINRKHFARNECKLSETTTNKRYYYHTDHLGSVTVMTDELGNAVWKDEYLAFGQGKGAGGIIEEPNIYTGKELDSDNGLYYFNARWYDPEIGRFISEDPAKDGSNWYVYCANNPLVFVDDRGLDVAVVAKRYIYPAGQKLDWGHIGLWTGNDQDGYDFYSFEGVVPGNEKNMMRTAPKKGIAGLLFGGDSGVVHIHFSTKESLHNYIGKTAEDGNVYDFQVELETDTLTDTRIRQVAKMFANDETVFWKLGGPHCGSFVALVINIAFNEEILDDSGMLITKTPMNIFWQWYEYVRLENLERQKKGQQEQEELGVQEQIQHEQNAQEQGIQEQGAQEPGAQEQNEQKQVQQEED